MRRAALLILLPLILRAAEPPLIRIEGGYTAYSYDHAQIMGEDVKMSWFGWTVAAKSLKLDLGVRTGAAYGSIIMTKGDAKLEADELLFDAGAETGILVRFGENMRALPFPGDRKIDDPGAEARARRAALEGVSWAKMRGSLLYASARAIDVLPSYEAYGDDVLMHVEGLDSVGFKRIKLSGGAQPKAGGLTLDRVWFSRLQGVFGDLSLTLNKEKLLRSRTLLHYEEHTILSNYVGLPRQLDLQTSNVWSAKEGLDLGLDGNYSSTGLGNAKLFALVKSRDAKRTTTFDLAYNKPLQSDGETWLGVRTDLRSTAGVS
jgi:hypothetical protein